MPKVLVIVEHDEGQLKLATLSAVSFASKLVAETGGTFELLVIGREITRIAESLRPYSASTILTVDHPELEYPVGDKYAEVVNHCARQRGANFVVAAASTFSKDILPRAAALLDAGMLSDVIEARQDGEDFTFRRIMYAGNVIATVKLAGDLRFLTIRPAAFAHPAKGPNSSPVENLSLDPKKLPSNIAYESREGRAAGRPDSTEARVVISGGRAIKSAEDFERLIGGLADALHGAVGSSRALVDAGITPNSLQVGQTGKIVAPELYIAVGVSGAIQHLAGIKDAKVIVAINKDAEAPIFEVADFGLVADAYQVVPELVEKLRR